MTPQEKEKLKNSLKNHTSPYDGNDGMISTIIAQMLVDDMPEPKKVKVPKWFAEWIERWKPTVHFDKYKLLKELWRQWESYDGRKVMNTLENSQTYWLTRNVETATKAILYGYEIEEPLYIMPVPYAENMCYYKNEDGEMEARFDSDVYTEFTVAEINEHFPKIKEFAEEVEG